MNRQTILEASIKATMEDRNKTYGPPSVQLDCASRLIEVYRSFRQGQYPLSHDRAIEDCLQKISRIACGVYKEDNYIDLAAYAGIAGELGGPPSPFVANLALEEQERIANEGVKPGVFYKTKMGAHQESCAHIWGEPDSANEVFCKRCGISSHRRTL